MALTSLTCGLHPHPWAQEVQPLSPPQSVSGLCWRRVGLLPGYSHVCVCPQSPLIWPSAHRLPSWLGPSSLQSLCSLDLTYGLTSKLDLKPASKPWYLLQFWTHGWTWPLSLGQSCSDVVGLGLAMLSCCFLTRPEAPKPGYNLF